LPTVLLYAPCSERTISRRPNWFDAMLGSHETIFNYFRGPANADENLQALEDQLLETGPEAGAHHSHADHHRDEQHASPEAQTRVSPPFFGCLSTGKFFCSPIYFSLSTLVLQSCTVIFSQ
jgi:hypothetical protein